MAARAVRYITGSLCRLAEQRARESASISPARPWVTGPPGPRPDTRAPGAFISHGCQYNVPHATRHSPDLGGHGSRIGLRRLYRRSDHRDR
jgi:hypothetical protein